MGHFDGLTSLQELDLSGNQLSALPDGVFNGLTSLLTLRLNGNHLVGLTENDPLFAGLPRGTVPILDGQVGPPERQEEPETPEEPEQPEEPEEPETPSNGLAAKVATLETRMAVLEAAMAAQRTVLEATNSTLQDIANRVSALEQREPEVRTSTRFIPVPVERE